MELSTLISKLEHNNFYCIVVVIRNSVVYIIVLYYDTTAIMRCVTFSLFIIFILQSYLPRDATKYVLLNALAFNL